jgi:flagellar hook-associated protein 1 FlgK
MTLSSAAAIATQSLQTITSQINVVSRNISGVNTPGYAAKIALVTTNGMGAAQIDGVTQATNAALFQSSLQATSLQAAYSALSNGLKLIDQSMNISAGSASNSSTNTSPATLISALSGALQQYSSSPSSVTSAQSVLTAAQQLVQGLNNATTAVQQVRQQADAGIASSVSNINSILSQFQQVNSDIVSGTQAGRDVTDSLDKRNALLSQLSKEIGITTITRQNNDMVIYTDGGATLFETTPRTVAFQPTVTYVAGTVGNAVFVDGVQVTGPNSTMAIRSGNLQGLTQLRDVAAPMYQNQLDETARGLITAFSEIDQTNPSAGPSLPGLFTYAGATATPGPSLAPGLAGEIVINASVDPSQGGNLNLLRDGGISGPGNTYNTTGAAGYSTRIQQLISSLTATQTFDASAGLGAQQSLTDFATSSLGWLEAQRQQADNSASYQNTLVSQTSQALSNATGVNLDDQMSKMLDLENSYQASAKLLATVNSMYSVLFQSITLNGVA